MVHDYGERLMCTPEYTAVRGLRGWGILQMEKGDHRLYDAAGLIRHSWWGP